MLTNNTRIDGIWYRLYVGVRRTNEAIKVLKKFDASVDPSYNSRLGEMYFLRGYWYLKLKMLFKNIPYLTDETPDDEYSKVSNKELSDQEGWDFIAADFKRAIDLLPDNQAQRGRANKIAAHAYYAKTRLYQAYKQNEEHEVIDIDKTMLNEVLLAADVVLQSTYGLEDDFAKNFIFEFENGKESIFAIQFSTDDGVGTAGRTDKGYYITAPQGQGCCDFHKPSQNLVNAYKTQNGLPLLSTFNNSDANFTQDELDPRLDHTVARVGMPFKYDATRIYANSWSRVPGVYGNYHSLKENVSQSCNCFKIDGSFRGNSKNRIEMRYSDVLLFKAEALIELDRYAEALNIINQIRNRAANSINYLKDGQTPRANYNVKPYVAGVDVALNKNDMRTVLRMERRLELAMESSRFFDLVRWGIAAETLNAFYDVERIRKPNLYSAASKFTAKRNEYLPIPQQQINFSAGLYIQNPNYE